MSSAPLAPEAPDADLAPDAATDAAVYAAASERLPGDATPVDLDEVEPGGVARSAISQFGAKFVHFGLNAVSTLALIRHLGPSGYGDYLFVITASFVIGILSDMGLNNLAVREVSRDPKDEERLVGSVMLTRLLLGAGAWTLTLLVVWGLERSTELLAAAAVISTLFFTEAILAIIIRFHVRVEQQYEALVRVAIEALETTLVLVLIFRGASLVQLVAAPPAAAIVGVVLALWLSRARHGKLPRLQLHASRRLLREALPIGLTLLLAAAYLRSPALAVASMRGADDAGHYGAAYQLIEYLLLASAVVINVLLPLLSRSWVADRARFTELYRTSTEALLVLTIPVVVVIVVAGPELVRRVYGESYEASTGPLQILAIALVPMVLNFWHSIVLLAGGQQRVTLAYDLVGFVVTLGLCLALIPSHGPTGAAVALLVTSVVVLGCAVVATTRRLGVAPDLRRVAPIAAIGLVVGVAAMALDRAGVPVALAVGGPLLAGGVLLRPRRLLLPFLPQKVRTA